MLFVTTQPDSDYYIWQLQVQLNNFKKFGCEDKCIVIFGYNPLIGLNENVLEFEKNTRAKVLCYPDTRDLSMRIYAPSIRPHLLKQLYEKDFEIISNKNFIYLDCDVLFANYPDFSTLNDEKVIHVSDSSSHIPVDAIKDMDYDVFVKMCKTVGISPYIVEKNRAHSGGITYLFKHFNYMDYAFWDKVEKDSAALYKIMLVSINTYSPVQMMTANKCALLWNLWLIGFDTKISPHLSLSWADSPIEEWEKHNLYNNAGVQPEEKHYLFYKGDFDEKTPFDADLSYVSDKYCSFKYVEEIALTAKAINYSN